MSEAPRWSIEQDRILNALWEKGLDDFVIGERMGKKGSSVGNRRRYLGLPANTAPRLVWTQERVEILKTLWARGLTAEEIGCKIGASRNAILGKRMRLGLPGRDSARSRKRFRPVLRFGKKRKLQKPNQKSWATELARLERRRPSDPPPSERVALVDLEADQCRFPLGDPEHEDFGFCGAKAANGYPYCAAHCARAYLSSPAEGAEPFSPSTGIADGLDFFSSLAEGASELPDPSPTSGNAPALKPGNEKNASNSPTLKSGNEKGSGNSPTLKSGNEKRGADSPFPPAGIVGEMPGSHVRLGQMKAQPVPLSMHRLTKQPDGQSQQRPSTSSWGTKKITRP